MDDRIKKYLTLKKNIRNPFIPKPRAPGQETNENTKSFEVPISISSYGFIQPEDEASIYEDIKTFSNTLLEDTKNTNIEQTQKTIEKKLAQCSRHNPV